MRVRPRRSVLGRRWMVNSINCRSSTCSTCISRVSSVILRREERKMDDQWQWRGLPTCGACAIVLQAAASPQHNGLLFDRRPRVACSCANSQYSQLCPSNEARHMAQPVQSGVVSSGALCRLTEVSRLRAGCQMDGEALARVVPRDDVERGRIGHHVEGLADEAR